ncbi:aluminum activated malate transporter-domain-containing protein [Entophlyctis helioformis]|nr:aluminum activated malate transporter-domain-containing protein [Entophlyctis helioformis]
MSSPEPMRTPPVMNDIGTSPGTLSGLVPGREPMRSNAVRMAGPPPAVPPLPMARIHGNFSRHRSNRQSMPAVMMHPDEHWRSPSPQSVQSWSFEGDQHQTPRRPADPDRQPQPLRQDDPLMALVSEVLERRQEFQASVKQLQAHFASGTAQPAGSAAGSGFDSNDRRGSKLLRGLARQWTEILSPSRAARGSSFSSISIPAGVSSSSSVSSAGNAAQGLAQADANTRPQTEACEPAAATATELEDEYQTMLATLSDLNERLKKRAGRAMGLDTRHDTASRSGDEEEGRPLLSSTDDEGQPSLPGFEAPQTTHSSSAVTAAAKAAAGPKPARLGPLARLRRRVRFEFARNRAFRHAFQISVAITLATLLTFVDVLRKPIKGKGWAAITVAMTYESTYGGFLRKAMQRILGTLIGGFIGLVFVASAFALPPPCLQCDYKPYFLASSIFVGIFILNYRKIHNPREAYVYLIMGMTILIVVLGEYADPVHREDWDPDVPFYLRPFYDSAMYRIGLVITGVAISFVVSTFVLPERASTRLPEKFGIVMMQIADLQAYVHASYMDGDHNGSHGQDCEPGSNGLPQTQDTNGSNSGSNSSSTAQPPFSMSLFRDHALMQADLISREIEKLRVLVENALDEIFLSPGEKKVTAHAAACLQGIERIFYLTVTMVYGRMWTTDSCALHLALEDRLHVLIDMLDTIMRTTARVFQRRLIAPEIHDQDPQLLSPDILPLLRDATYMTIEVFRKEQARLHVAAMQSAAYSEKDWANWNHFALSFLQCLVNLAAVIESGMNMS